MEQAANEEKTAKLHMQSGEKKYFLFLLGRQLFAVDIAEVSQILAMRPLAKVPHTPDYFGGTMELRGNMISVLDLRALLGCEQRTVTAGTCIIVSGRGKAAVGYVIDGVYEVRSIADRDIQNPARISRDMNPALVAGISLADGRMLLHINLKNIVDFRKNNI